MDIVFRLMHTEQKDRAQRYIIIGYGFGDDHLGIVKKQEVGTA